MKMVVAIAQRLIPTRQLFLPTKDPNAIPNYALKQRMRQRVNRIENASALA